MSDASGAGGSANELGSRHRAGAAALLAVHGLVERPLRGLSGEFPVAISLEAAEAVDDIVCTMANGVRWFVQSKRSSGMDANLRAAARQWARQDLSEGDRVALVSRNLRGILTDLQGDIQRKVLGDPISRGGARNVDSFVSLLEQQGVNDAQGLLARVQLIEWKVDEAGDADLETGIAMLANTIVRHDQAPLAFELLRQRMQLAAGRRETTTDREWISCLVDAGIQLFPDGQGASGARELARKLALDSYRTALAARRDRLDLSALVPDVPEIVVEDALRGWQVSSASPEDEPRRSTDVLNVIRGTPRLIIAGLPGMGKSELMRQIAARLADDDLAPVPILVDLRHLTSHVQTPTDITLDLLLDRPSRMATGQDPEIVKRALTRAVVGGEAILLLDGLDEAQRARSQVAAGLARLVQGLPSETGLVITTRDSGLLGTGQLGIPVVRLDTPLNLRDAMSALITALAPARTSPAELPDWVAARATELGTLSDAHGDIWSVPLLATLATVRLAQGRRATTSVADLLNQVIQDSVTGWELRRAEGRDGFSQSLEPEMLLSGFAAIGHELVSASSISRADALSAVSTSLQEWRLARPLERTIADQIVTFWDDQVGVFVASDGEIVPRSRQFAELAEARWLSDKDEVTRRSWLMRAVNDDLYENAVSLAASADEVVRSALITAASRTGRKASRVRAATWLARQWASWAEDVAVQHQIIDVLADGAEDRLPAAASDTRLWRALEIKRQRSGGEGWALVLSLARASLPLELDVHRTKRIRGFDLAPARRTVVVAILGLVQAEAEGRPLDRETVAAVDEVISTPHPETPEPFYNDNGVLVIGSPSHGYVTGVGEVAELAIGHLSQFPEGTADTLYAIAGNQTLDRYGRMERKLQSLGFLDPAPWWSGLPITGEWSRLREDHDGIGWLLRTLDQLAPVVGSEPARSWRFSELGRLIRALGYAHASMSGLSKAADEHSDVLQAWIAAHIEALGLDKVDLAREARQLLTSRDAKEARNSIVYGRLQPDDVPTAIREDTALALVPVFNSPSEWIVNSSFRLLADTRYPLVSEALSKLTGHQSWRTAFERTIVIVANSDNRMATVTSMIESESPAVRAGLGAVLQAGYPDRPDLLDVLRNDSDGEVRHFSGGDPSAASSWVCTSCGATNAPDRNACARCHATASWA